MFYAFFFSDTYWGVSFSSWHGPGQVIGGVTHATNGNLNLKPSVVAENNNKHVQSVMNQPQSNTETEIGNARFVVHINMPFANFADVADTPNLVM